MVNTNLSLDDMLLLLAVGFGGFFLTAVLGVRPLTTMLLAFGACVLGIGVALAILAGWHD